MSEENPKQQKEQPPSGGGDPQLNWRGLVLLAVGLALIGGVFLFRGGNLTQTDEISNKQFLDYLKEGKVLSDEKHPVEVVVEEGRNTQTVTGFYNRGKSLTTGNEVESPFRTQVFMPFNGDEIKAALTAAGITVEQQKSAELEFMQRAWLTKQLLGRPLMIWKVAMTLDSKVAASDGTSQWISGPESRDDVQVLRAQSDAIVIGTNTAIIDNPHLVPRGHAARPVRIVCGEQVVPPTHNVFDEQARTITVKSKSIPELMKVLSDEGFNQVLVEAGPTLGSALMATGNIDELIIYQAPKLLGAGKEFVSHLGISTLADHIGLELISAAQFGSDTKSHYRIVKGR